MTPNKKDRFIKLHLVPVEVFGASDGYGLMDAVNGFSDCNRAVGKIYRVDDLDNKHRGEGDTVAVYVEKKDLKFFDKKWGDK